MTAACYDWIAHHAMARGERLAMVDLHTGRRFTYADFDIRVGRLAGALRAATGVSKGDRIAVLAHSSTDLFELQFSCARLGAIFTPLNWRLTLAELTYIVGDAEPLALFDDPGFAETARDLDASCGIRHLLSGAPDANDHERMIAAGPALAAIEPLTHDDPATILYTSGTTGRPKGAIITHGARFWQTST